MAFTVIMVSKSAVLLDKKNKKGSGLSVLRYPLVFFVSIAAVFLLTIASCLIPHDLIKDNTIKSVEETAKVVKESRQNQKPYQRFEAYGDIRNYTMFFFADSSDPVRAAVEMNYDPRCDDSTRCADVLKKWPDDENNLISYNRYWQGQSVALHFLTIFGSFLSIRTFLTILFILLLAFVTYKIFKEDKKLAVAFIVGLISVNIAFVTRSLEYLPIFFVMLIAILLVLKSHKNKDKNLGFIFLVTGVLTCYFDFLTCETIALSVPLLIYTYLEIKAGKKVSFKKIATFSILWGIGYAGAFISKWIISFIFMGPVAMESVFGNILGHPLNGGLIGKIFAALNLSFSKLLPFALIKKYSGIVAMICFVICLVYTIRKNKRYLPLFIICIIPILRFIVVSSHSILLSFFTYRALLCVAILTALIIIHIIVEVFTNFRKNIRKRKITFK